MAPLVPRFLALHPEVSLSLNLSDRVVDIVNESFDCAWAFTIDGEATYLRPTGRLDCTDGQVLHTWCSAGLGLAWRSGWEVQQEMAAGTMVSVLDAFAAPPNGIYAVFPHAKHLALRVRLWIDFLKHSYGDSAYWNKAPAARA